MKRIIALLLVLSLLLTACAQQKAVETAPVEVPAVEPVVETPAVEPVVETPAVEAPAEQPVAETPAAPAETPKAETNEQFFDVKKGDTITYKTTTFVIEDLTNSGNYMTLYFDPVRFHLYELNKPEILNGIEYTIVENNFNRQNSVKLRVKPLVLGKDEYLLEKGDAVTVKGTTLILGNTQLDERKYESAYFSIGWDEYWVGLGSTVKAGNLTITLKSAYYRQKQYAILKIVPK